MQGACFLGIDNGGTLTKAVLFDSGGTEIAGASRKVSVIAPQPGFTERDMGLLWQANCDVIRETIARSGGALGCAMAAAVASGVYKDLKDAATHMVTITHRFEPDAGKAAVYARKYQRYQNVSGALEGIWGA